MVDFMNYDIDFTSQRRLNVDIRLNLFLIQSTSSIFIQRGLLKENGKKNLTNLFSLIWQPCNI